MSKVRFFIQVASLGFFMVLSLTLPAQTDLETTQIKKIWDRARHNAFTDITYSKNKLFVVFREGDGHIPNDDNTGNGKIRVLSSADGEYWESVALIELEGVDLRDPKISYTPKKRMLIVMGGSVYENGELKSIATFYSFSDAVGKKFTDPEPIVIDEEIKSDFDWLWRVTWKEKTGYGVMYQPDAGDEEGNSKAYLLQTSKGEEYELITELDIPGNPNEATIRFLSRGEMMIIARRGGEENTGMMGTSMPPYKDWTWKELPFELGGPNFEVVPINKLLLATRIREEGENFTTLFLGKKDEDFKEVMRLPSGGDTSYAGMFTFGGFIWMSYYSSHEGKASIYYARIPFKELY